MRVISPATRTKLVFGYASTVLAVAVGAFYFWTIGWGAPKPAYVLFFWVLFAVAHRVPIEARVGGVLQAGVKPRLPLLSAGFLVLMTAAFTTSPATAALVGIASPFVPGLWRGRLRAAFNGGQASLYTGAASASYFLIQARFGHNPAALLLAAGAGALVACFLNTTLVAGVMALERGRALLGLLKELAWPTAASWPFALVALLVAILFHRSPAAPVFILAPLFVLRGARQSKVDLDNARDRTLRAFVGAVDVKDPFTSRHSERVAMIAVDLHRALGTEEREVERRQYGALLHDIGKIGVSGRILTKPDRLTEDEYEIIQRHPGTGGFVVSRVSWLRDLLPEVLYHHERIDGHGYPTGLAGEEIPFAARVLAVADTFEALTSDRPYRKALSIDQALGEIQRSAGSQLDPTVVDVLVGLVHSGHVFPYLTPRTTPLAAPVQSKVALEA